jgi:hypothetical protein
VLRVRNVQHLSPRPRNRQSLKSKSPLALQDECSDSPRHPPGGSPNFCEGLVSKRCSLALTFSLLERVLGKGTQEDPSDSGYPPFCSFIVYGTILAVMPVHLMHLLYISSSFFSLLCTIRSLLSFHDSSMFLNYWLRFRSTSRASQRRPGSFTLRHASEDAHDFQHAKNVTRFPSTTTVPESTSA